MLFDNVSSAFEVVQIVVSALIGLFGVAAALNGFVYKKIPMLFRLAMAAGGLCMMIPGTASDVVGLDDGRRHRADPAHERPAAGCLIS